MSYNLRRVAPYVPAKLQASASEQLHNLVYRVVDKVAPGLGKQEKAAAVYQVQKIVKKLGSYTDQAITNAAKSVFSSGSGFPVPSKSKMTITREGGRSSTVNAKSNSSVGGGVAIGGTTTYAPVAVSRNISRRSKPKMSVRGDSFVVSHSEMLGAVLSGSPTSNVTAYRSVGFRANPGISTIFPWLSTMAVNYEKYRFRKLRFTVVPLVSTAFSGRIGVGFDFDSSDTAPGNRQEFYALTTHSESMPWQACAVDVRTDNIFRFTGTHVAADNKLIDLGQVIVMSDAISNGTIAAAIPLYDLIVDYEVELIEPQQSLFSTQAFANSGLLVAGVPLGTGVDSTIIAGPQVVSSTTVTASVLTVVLPAGTYQFCTRMNWTTGTATYAVATTTTGATLKVDTFAGGSFAASIGTVSSISDVTLTFTVGTVTYTAAMNAFNLIVCRVNSAIAANYLA